jgi:hypothetical protein
MVWFNALKRAEYDYIVLMKDLKLSGDHAAKQGNMVKARLYYASALKFGENIRLWSEGPKFREEIVDILRSEDMLKVAAGFVWYDGKWVKRENFLKEYHAHGQMEKDTETELSAAESAFESGQYDRAATGFYRVLRTLVENPWLRYKMGGMDSVTERAASIPEGVTTPMHLAVKDGNIDVIKLLLKRGVSPDIKDNTGRTALYTAFTDADPAVVELLLQHGANPDAGDGGGGTLLHLALRRGDADMAVLLLEHGADPDMPDGSGLPPLHMALAAENITVFKQLLARGADPDAVDNNGVSALEAAYAKSNGEELVRMLLGSGADRSRLEPAVRNALESASMERAEQEVHGIALQIDRILARGSKSLIIVDRAAMEGLMQLSRKVSLWFAGLNSDGSNIREVLQSATSAFNTVARKQGGQLSGTEREMYEMLVRLGRKYAYEVDMHYGTGGVLVQAMDPGKHPVKNDRLASATPFVFGKYNYLVMQYFPSLPGVIYAVSEKILEQMTMEELDRLAGDHP